MPTPFDTYMPPRAANPQGSLTGLIDRMRGVPTRPQIEAGLAERTYQRGQEDIRNRNRAAADLLGKVEELRAANPNATAPDIYRQILPEITNIISDSTLSVEDIQKLVGSAITSTGPERLPPMSVGQSLSERLPSGEVRPITSQATTETQTVQGLLDIANITDPVEKKRIVTSILAGKSSANSGLVTVPVRNDAGDVIGTGLFDKNNPQLGVMPVQGPAARSGTTMPLKRGVGDHVTKPVVPGLAGGDDIPTDPAANIKALKDPTDMFFATGPLHFGARNIGTAAGMIPGMSGAQELASQKAALDTYRYSLGQMQTRGKRLKFDAELISSLMPGNVWENPKDAMRKHVELLDYVGNQRAQASRVVAEGITKHSKQTYKDAEEKIEVLDNFLASSPSRESTVARISQLEHGGKGEVTPGEAIRRAKETAGAAEKEAFGGKDGEVNGKSVGQMSLEEIQRLTLDDYNKLSPATVKQLMDRYKALGGK